MLCTFCASISIETLCALHEKHKASHCYVFEDFATNAYHPLQPTFNSLVIAAEAGCELCIGIYEEFKTVDLLKCIQQKETLGLDTSVGICLSVNDKESNAPNAQLFDRILVRVGLDIKTEDDSDNSDDMSSESGIEEELDASSEYSSTESMSRYPSGCTVVFSLTRHKSKCKYPALYFV
jgi:hypothetical protein